VRVRVASHGDTLRAGCAYVAPDGVQMRVHASGHVVLADEPPRHGFRPSVGVLFASVAEQFGARAAAVLLSGMGRDGARELKALRDAGALTVVQDRASAAVHGMPGEALRLGAAMQVLAPEDIAAALNELDRLRKA
jgi:two-component system chemotaxis response regulator CheB